MLVTQSIARTQDSLLVRALDNRIAHLVHLVMASLFPEPFFFRVHYPHLRLEGERVRGNWDWQQHPAVARTPSTTSTLSKPWALEETRDGASIMRIRGVPDPTTVESSASASHSGGGALPRASLVPPLLPPMPSVPRTASTKWQYRSRSRRWCGARRRPRRLRHPSCRTCHARRGAPRWWCGGEAVGEGGGAARAEVTMVKV